MTHQKNYGSTSTTDDFNVAFSPTELVVLKENIVSSTLFVKSRYQKLEKVSKIIGTNKDNASTRDKITQLQTTTNERIQQANRDLHRLTSIVKKSGDKQQKLQVEKLVCDFKNVAEKYIACQKALAQKLRKIHLVNIEEESSVNGGSSSGDFDNQNQKLLMEKEIHFDRDLLMEREKNFLQIESEISDINQLMNELSAMTQEQGDSIETIENSVEQSAQNVESGADELEKAQRFQAKFKRKLIILFMIALIVTIVILFLIFRK